LLVTLKKKTASEMIMIPRKLKMFAEKDLIQIIDGLLLVFALKEFNCSLQSPGQS
jgi:hypothetical protein